MKRICFFPGTFDPVTYGHIDIIERASNLFDEVIVGVYDGKEKSCLFNIDERIDMIENAVQSLKTVIVKRYRNLTAIEAIMNGAGWIVRGLRIGIDFEYERGMAMVNRTISNRVETICLMSRLEYQILSSSRTKEIAKLGGNIDQFVTNYVKNRLIKKIA